MDELWFIVVENTQVEYNVNPTHIKSTDDYQKVLDISFFFQNNNKKTSVWVCLFRNDFVVMMFVMPW